MNIFLRIFATLRLNFAISKADTAFATTGERHYVMPQHGSRRLVVVDRRNFRLLRRKGYINPKATVTDMISECFYHTPYRDGSGILAPDMAAQKRKAYLRWFARQ
ncbi:hypothetical protein [Paramuribaculum intestinale]|uniref:hypothetical protein n=2 Tax=Paramuribaculum intestinale TaxID=2094151 RepID=UPI00272999BD|nr:hypothetical protein [Paramuribaculum intestinale]